MEFSHLQRVALADLPELAAGDFSRAVSDCLSDQGRLAALFAAPQAGGRSRIYAIVAKRGANMSAFRSVLLESYPSLTPAWPQAHWLERIIFEESGVVPLGHPWLKPVRFNAPGERRALPGVTDYFKVKGIEIHEVAVGPVHAGIIEPGHFRFQCYGENVYHLEISLGYQHRGVEQAVIKLPGRRLKLMETLAGDTSIGHSYAYAELCETLSGCEVSPRARLIRRLALELERLANHTGDLGAMAGDVAYLPTSSFCGRLRGDFLNMTALICGNRFGRNLLRPGGVNFDLDEALTQELAKRLELTGRDVNGALDLLFASASVLNRFENTGKLSPQIAIDLGLVGPAARACAVMRDARRNRPAAGCDDGAITPQLSETCDVFGRANVRRLEIAAALKFISERLEALPEGEIRRDPGPLAANSLAMSFIEGWRGEICHVGITGGSGEFKHYKVIDPSVRNWSGLAMALRGEQVSDFPLCNKSFNLSYCGHDL